MRLTSAISIPLRYNLESSRRLFSSLSCDFNSTKVQFGGCPLTRPLLMYSDFNSTKVQFGVIVQQIDVDIIAHFNSTKVQFGGQGRTTSFFREVFQFH